MKYWVIVENALEIDADDEEAACIKAMEDCYFNFNVQPFYEVFPDLKVVDEVI